MTRKQGDFLVDLQAQVEISLVVSSRLLLCYRSGLARIVFGLDLEGSC